MKISLSLSYRLATALYGNKKTRNEITKMYNMTVQMYLDFVLIVFTAYSDHIHQITHPQLMHVNANAATHMSSSIAHMHWIISMNTVKTICSREEISDRINMAHTCFLSGKGWFPGGGRLVENPFLTLYCSVDANDGYKHEWDTSLVLQVVCQPLISLRCPRVRAH